MRSPTSRPEAGADAGFFDDAYYRLLEPFHTEEQARLEVGGIREILGLAQDDRILDLGCGWGRHLALLTGAGHRVVGLDRSMPLLHRARRGLRDTPERQRTGEDDLGGGPVPAPHLIAGDMLHLPLADATMDAVLNLATSLGLFLDDALAVRALAEARRVLRPGGRLLVEGMHRHDVEAHVARRDAGSRADGTRGRTRRRFDARRGISHEVLRWDGPDGAGRKRHSLRIRTGDEMQGLAERAGLHVTDRLGDWNGEPFAPDAPRLILLAEAPRHTP